MALTLPVATHERLSFLERGLARNVVTEVLQGSTALRNGIQTGDRIVTANGAPLRDIVDWKFHTAGDSVALEVLRGDVALAFTFRKGYDEDLEIHQTAVAIQSLVDQEVAWTWTGHAGRHAAGRAHNAPILQCRWRLAPPSLAERGRPATGVAAR